MDTRECIFCGTILDEEDKSLYACDECLKKVNILKQLTKVDKAREIIEFIVDKRNFDNRFRDTRWDKNYLEQYLSLQHQIRRGIR